MVKPLLVWIFRANPFTDRRDSSGRPRRRFFSVNDLATALHDWVEFGYSVKLGIELERYLLQSRAGGWQNYHNNPRSAANRTGARGDPSGFMNAVIDAG